MLIHERTEYLIPKLLPALGDFAFYTNLNNGQMEELIKITTRGNGSKCVNARDLYEFFAPTERFGAWVNRNLDYGFKIHYDFTPIKTLHPKNGQEIDDFVLTMDCAKQISMLQRSELGTKARMYFIEMEKLAIASLAPVVAFEIPSDFEAALRLAADQQKLIKEQTNLIEAQTTYIEEVKPKAEFYDQVTGSSDCFDMGSVAKVCNLGIGRNKLFEWLRGEKILMLNNTPYQAHIDNGHFRVVETKFNLPDGTIKINIKTLVLQKGIDYIIKRYQNRKR